MQLIELFLVCLVFFILGIVVIVAGIHNIDQGRNIMYILAGDSLKSYLDCNSFGCLDFGYLHTIGMDMLLGGFFLLGISWTIMFWHIFKNHLKED